MIDGFARYVTRCLAIGFDELTKMAALDINMPCLIFKFRNCRRCVHLKPVNLVKLDQVYVS